MKIRVPVTPGTASETQQRLHTLETGLRTGNEYDAFMKLRLFIACHHLGCIPQEPESIANHRHGT